MKKYRFWAISLMWALLIWHLTTSPQLIVAEDSLLQSILMMGAHFFFFGVQAILIYWAWPISQNALIASSLYGALIEYIQLSVPGRSGDPVDWVLDTLGAYVFLIIVTNLKVKRKV